MSHIQHKEWLALPAAVAIAGAFIGGGIYFGLSDLGNGTYPTVRSAASANQPAANTQDAQQQAAAKPAPVSPQDHIRGKVGARAVIIEFSDTECPFCKVFHSTIKQVAANHAAKGDLMWVYRQFPIEALHPKAHKEAEATECAAELGGNDGFWKYLDRIFEVTPSNNRLDPSALSEIAQYAGLDKAKFESCLASGKYAAKVDAQIKDGTTAGVQGTPTSFIVTAKGYFPVRGAVSADQLEKAIQGAI